MQSKPVLALLVALTLFFAWSVFGFWTKMSETEKSREIAENKVTELEGKKQKLGADIEKLGTEAGIEENIRAQFGLAKAGEGVIIIVDDKSAEEPKKEGGGFLNWLKNLLK